MPLYIAISQYLVDRADVAPIVPAHRDWILKHYTSGRMLASGPLSTSAGGALIFRAADLEAAHALLAQDPLTVAGVAAYDTHELTPTPSPWRNTQFDAFESAAPT